MLPIFLAPQYFVNAGYGVGIREKFGNCLQGGYIMEKLKNMLAFAFVCAFALTITGDVSAMDVGLDQEQEFDHPELLAMIKDLVRKPSGKGSTPQEKQLPFVDHDLQELVSKNKQQQEQQLENEKILSDQRFTNDVQEIATNPSIIRRCGRAVLNNKLTTLVTVSGTTIGIFAAQALHAPTQGVVALALCGACLGLPTWLLTKICGCLCGSKKEKSL